MCASETDRQTEKEREEECWRWNSAAVMRVCTERQSLQSLPAPLALTVATEIRTSNTPDQQASLWKLSLELIEVREFERTNRSLLHGFRSQNSRRRRGIEEWRWNLIDILWGLSGGEGMKEQTYFKF